MSHEKRALCVRVTSRLLMGLDFQFLNRFLESLEGLLQDTSWASDIHPHEHGSTATEHGALVEPEFSLLQHELLERSVVHTQAGAVHPC